LGSIKGGADFFSGAAQLASSSATHPVNPIAVKVEAFICMAGELNEEPRLTPAPSGVLRFAGF
jgi:hypothetical protein